MKYTLTLEKILIGLVMLSILITNTIMLVLALDSRNQRRRSADERREIKCILLIDQPLRRNPDGSKSAAVKSCEVR